MPYRYTCRIQLSAGLALAWHRQSAYKMQSPHIREQQNSVLQFYFIKNQILIVFRYCCHVAIYPQGLGVLTIMPLKAVLVIIVLVIVIILGLSGRPKEHIRGGQGLAEGQPQQPLRAPPTPQQEVKVGSRFITAPSLALIGQSGAPKL